MDVFIKEFSKTDLKQIKNELKQLSPTTSFILTCVPKQYKSQLADLIPCNRNYDWLEESCKLETGKNYIIEDTYNFSFDGLSIEINPRPQQIDYKKVVQNTNNEIFAFDTETFKFRFANKSALKNLQYSLEELKEMTPLDIKPQLNKEEFIRMAKPLLEGKEDSLVFETIHQRKDGSTYHVKVNLHITHQKGASYFNAIITDISERVQQTEEIQLAKERFELALKGSKDGFWDYDCVNDRIESSAKMYEMLGLAYDSDKKSIEFWRNTIHPDYKEENLRFVKEAMDSDVTEYELESIRIHADGHEVPVLVRACITRNEKGEAVRLTGTIMDTTKIKAAEKALRENEAKHRFLLENSKELIAIHNTDASFKFLSPSTLKILGYSPEELIGKNPFDYFHPDDMEKMKKEVHEELIKGNNVENIHHRFRRKDGKYIWLDTYYDIIQNSKNEMEAFFCGSRNITDLKETELKLAESEEMLSSIADGIPGIIMRYIIKPDGTDQVLYVSQGAEKLWEVPANLVMEDAGRVWAKVHPDDLEELMASVEESANNLTTWENEHRVIMDNGKIKWIIATAKPKRLEDGSTLWHTVALDITDKKVAQLELENTLSILNLGIETAEMGIWELDLTMDHLSWNQQMFDIFEVDKENFQHKINDFRALVNPEDLELADKEMEKIALGKTVKDISFRIKTAKGNTKYISASGTPVLNAKGEVIKFMGVNIDVTETVDYQKSLENALSEKDILFKELHHRIKNNLQMVISLLYLKQESSKDKSLTAFIKETSTKIHSISAIHEQLLQIEDFDSLNIEEYLLRLINNLIRTYSNSISDYDLDVSICSKRLSIDTSLHLGLIVNEIISNIVKYAYPDQSGGKIFIRLQEKGDNYQLIIADEGLGISNDKMKNHIASYGLQLISLFTEQLNGELKIENKKGTRFTILFPNKE